MSRYIKTQDGIYTWDYPIETLIGSEIMAGADTIEDLCDGLIVENKENHSWFFMGIAEFKAKKEHLLNWTYTAFIKTDKGLIYVAKMNENGDLELL